MTTETVLKHLVWIGPASMFALGWILKRFRLYILARKTSTPAVSTEEVPGPLPSFPPLLPPEVLTGPAYVVAKSPERVRSEAIAAVMTEAMTRTGETVVLNIDNTTGAKPFAPSTDPKFTPPSLTIFDGPLLRDQAEENQRRLLYGHLDTADAEARGAAVRCYAMSPAEIDARIASYTAFRKRVDVEAALSVNRLDELKAWARTKAQGEFLTPEKRAEIITASLNGRTREVAMAEGWNEDQVIAAWIDYVVSAMQQMYAQEAMRSTYFGATKALQYDASGNPVV